MSLLCNLAQKSREIQKIRKMKVQIMNKLNLPKFKKSKTKKLEGKKDSEDDEKEPKSESESESDNEYESSPYQPSERSTVF